MEILSRYQDDKVDASKHAKNSLVFCEESIYKVQRLISSTTSPQFPTPPLSTTTSLAVRSSINKLSSGVFTSTSSIHGTLDAGCSNSLAASLASPVKHPVIGSSRQLRLCRRSTSVCGTGTVRSTVRFIILMILLEDGEGLGARDTGVVGAFSGLDSLGDFGCCKGG